MGRWEAGEGREKKKKLGSARFVKLTTLTDRGLEEDQESQQRWALLQPG
jgi:hypothetical protein